MSAPKSTPAFEVAYQKLNPAQKQAVDAIDGPVMVIAGPGTGKTQILTTRIANILLKTDTNPASILALTFTESGATQMRSRLLSIIGEAAYHVRISTFHAFCASVIADNPEEFPLPHEAQPLTDLERFEIVSQIIRDNDLQVLKPINDPMYYAKAVVSNISQLKREGITPAAYETIIQEEGSLLQSMQEEMKKTEFKKRERNHLKHQDMVTLYHQYQSSLFKISRYDFDDMIALTAEAFATNDVLLAGYQERFQYFLVDEYQDTNGAQNNVVNLLASFWGEAANIFVVGDVNQSIYRFQGASAENVLSFLDVYPKAQVITLTENYRSTQKLLDAACTLITKNRPQQHIALSNPINLHSQIDPNVGQKPCLVHLPSSQLETVYIAESIQQRLADGSKPEEIAVIFRNNNDAAGISDTLARWNIPFDIEGGANVLTTPIITQLFVLLHCINDMRHNLEDLDLFTLLNYEWTNLDSLTILQYVREAQRRNKQLLDIILEQEKKKTKAVAAPQPELFAAAPTTIPTPTPPANDEESLPKTYDFNFASDAKQAAIQLFVLKLIDLMHQERTMTFVHWFELLLTESGFLDYVLKRESVSEDLNRINTLFNEIKKLCNTDHTCSLQRFLEIIATMNVHGLSITEEDQNISLGSVRLTTAHKAKGQEWDHVYIMTAIDGKWGNNAKRSQINVPESLLKKSKLTDYELETLEDERRLFYVALTRAKKSLTITVPDSVVSGSRNRETIPSLFVTELAGSAEVNNPEEFSGDKQRELLTRLLQPQPAPDHSAAEKAWLRSLVNDFRLSSTALNTYIDCHYKFKLNHLLKVPRAKPEPMVMGSAVHKALEMFFKRLQQTSLTPPVEFLLEAYEKALKKEVLTIENYNKRLTQGKAILSRYYEVYKEEFKSPLFVEKQFGLGLSKTIFEGIPLTGIVDRIDWINQSDGTVKIIDYKTGRPKSLNEIEGKTASSNGSYKRQLVFYKLLTQLDPAFHPKAEVFEFDFLEADKQTGKHKRVSIAIGNEEVEALKQEIKETLISIRALDFARTHDTRICHNCEFNRHCWPEGIPTTSTQSPT